jgi:hypothetical protein
MIKRCHKQDEFVDRIERALGVQMGDVSCKIVDTNGMAEVMSRAGWSKNEANGVVGFQIEKQVYVLDSAPWTVLHELVHRAGVNSDRLSRFVAEGLTEAIAAELKESDDEHRATYPTEVAWVRGTLLPRLQMSAVELGRVVARAQNAPRALAELMVKASPGADVSMLEYELRPQAPNQPSFNKRGHLTRSGSPAGSAAAAPVNVGRDRSPQVGVLLIVAGTALAAPALAHRIFGGPR